MKSKNKKSKFKVGDNVKWNDGFHYKDDKRIDVITEVINNIYGQTQYMTKQVNNKENEKPKIGIAYENYLVLAYPLEVL